MKSIKLILLLMFYGSISVFSQDNGQNIDLSNSRHKRDGRFFIRAGIGAQGLVSFFYPEDINNFNEDFYNRLTDQFEQLGFNSSSGDFFPKFFAGYGYSYKADLRIFNIFEVEPWWDNFYAFPVNMKMDYSYSNSYSGYEASSLATYEFQPIYEEKGISILFVPGSKRKHVFLTVGAGVGDLQGKFNIKTTGSQNINGNFFDFSNSESYTGRTTAIHGIIGITFVTWKCLELEMRLNGKSATIPSITNKHGEELIDIDKTDQVVALDYSSVDFRFGLTFIFP